LEFNVHAPNIPPLSFLERLALVSGENYEKREDEEEDHVHGDSYLL